MNSLGPLLMFLSPFLVSCSRVPLGFVQYMSSICSVFVQSYTEQIPNKYRTNIGQMPGLHRRCYKGNPQQLMTKRWGL